MAQLRLINGKTYELVTNGVLTLGDDVKFIFLPGEDSFEIIESRFDEINTQNIYIQDEDGLTLRSIVGYTKYKGMEKRTDYTISTRTVNTGTDEEPVYETQENTGTVMILTLSKPKIEDRVKSLEKANKTMQQVATFSAFGFTDQQAVQVKNLYPKWSDLADGTQLTRQEDAVTGMEITKVLGDDGKLYKVISSHQKQSNYAPGSGTESLFTIIDEEHAGTQNDPIPWSTNMISYNGKYYTYNGVMYKCIRDSGIALQYTPDQLLDNYFQTV